MIAGTTGSEALRPPPPIVNARAYAWFFDLDGTLVDIAERPADIRLLPSTRDALAALYQRSGGAVAIVSGREIAAVDAVLAPLSLPTAGVHGLTMRAAPYGASSEPHVAQLPEPIVQEIEALAARYPGLLVERKAGAAALHFRARPELAAMCLEAMSEIAAMVPGIEVKRGKMVVEVRAEGPDKGDAVRAFMSVEPFVQRIPLFVGDDVTDEDAFRFVNSADGLSVKIGPEPTVARFAFENTCSFLGWLSAAADMHSGGTRW